MSPRLSEIFGELGISQHLDAFVDQGFDTWETILDITESDLDTLGVKLGHRRKLQRRIANARGIPSNAVLASPIKPSADEIRSEANKPEAPISSITDGRDVVAAVQKRKYRRHPKHDENAPERPPSAYVLFSNKMRDDLKGQNLTFTEIAKLVGEHWQGLTQSEKEPFEHQAQTAKEKYLHDQAVYKQTSEYTKYQQYLQEFKAKHGSSHDKDGSKRARITGPAAATSNGMPCNQDGVLGMVDSLCIRDATDYEPPLRRQRINSTASNGECSYYAPTLQSGSMRTPTEESNAASPNGGYFDRRDLSPTLPTSPRVMSASTQPLRRDPSYVDASRNDGPPQPRHLPSLSDMWNGHPMTNGHGYPGERPQAQQIQQNMALLPGRYQTLSPAPTPGTSNGDSRPPSLKTEQSSAGSMSSGSSYSSYPRTPVEGPLPIHALLTHPKHSVPHDTSFPIIYRSLSPDDRGSTQYPSERAPSESMPSAPGMPHMNGYYSGSSAVSAHTIRPYLAYGGDIRGQAPPPPAPTRAPGPGPGTTVPTPRPGVKPEGGLDGISALLQADRIVDRRPAYPE